MPEKSQLTKKGVIVLSLAFLSAASGMIGYSTYSVVNAVEGGVEKAPAPVPNELLGNELNAAINEEIRRQKIEADEAPAIKKICDETTLSLNNTLSAAGIDVKVTGNFTPPGEILSSAYCALQIDNKAFAIIDDPEDAQNEKGRQYIVKELMKEIDARKFKAASPAPKP